MGRCHQVCLLNCFFSSQDSSLSYSILDADQEEFEQLQAIQDQDPAQILGPNLKNMTFTWDSPAIRKDLMYKAKDKISPGEYFQSKCPTLGNLDENISPDKRVR